METHAISSTDARSGIITIDTGFHRPRFDAAYLIVHRGRAAFVDTGTNHSLPRLLGALANAGLDPSCVDWVILTHVHLDHAGGAGALMQALPEARLVVHPRGAPHMIDPARLVAGATAVYGEAEMARSYGTLVPVPAERVDVAADGHVVDLAGRALVCLDSPGHARHHLVVHDPAHATFFTGDSFGLSYRELDSDTGAFILPTTTPVQFDPDALVASIRRMQTHQPKVMHLTHFGAVTGVDLLADALVEQVTDMVAIARDCARSHSGPARHTALTNALRTYYCARAQRHGVGLPASSVAGILEMDIELNAQGLGVWLDRQAQAGQPEGRA